MAERQGMPKCFVVRHEGNDANEHLSTMMWVRRRQLALPLLKSTGSQGDKKGRVTRPSTSATGSELGCVKPASNFLVKLCGNANRRIQDQIQSRLYYHLTPVNISSESSDGCGAVFNLEFSPNG